ncbi:hypothetical protein [Priestia megaterium]|jgi:hypothetical protein|nr:hypothetical protein [Priestia megaterium]
MSRKVGCIIIDEFYQKILDGELSDEEILRISEGDDEPLASN